MINVTTGSETFSQRMQVRLAYVTGIIDTSNVTKLERSIYRITREKILPSNINFPEEEMAKLRKRDPLRYDTNKTALFIVYPLSSNDSLISKRIVKMCEAYGAKLI